MNGTQNTFTDYLKNAYLAGLFSAVGIAAAVTLVIVAYPPMAFIAARFF